MKNKMIKPIFFFGLLGIVLATSCKKKIEDAYPNPNSPVVVPIETILPGVIGGFTAFFSSNGTGYGVQADGILLGRYIQYWGTQTNGELYGQMGFPGAPSSASDNTGGLWAAVYYGHGGNVNQIIQWGAEQQKWDYVGVGYAIRAWGWLELTNCYGDAILKEAFNTSLTQFKYDTQQEFYDSCRVICHRSLSYLNRTDGAVSQANLAVGDAFFYNGDVSKWKKFVYGILARSYITLAGKTDFVSSGYADSAIKYANLSLATNADNALVKVTGGLTSAVNNYFGPFRGNIGAIRQSAYIADLMSGTNAQAFTGVPDPRRYYMLRENLNGTFKGFTPWLGATGVAASDYPRNFWGTTLPTATAAPSPDSSRYLYQNASPWPMMTASEIQFIIAEAAYLKGDKTLALSAYTNGISLNFDMITTTYPQNVPTVFAITPANKAAYMSNTAVVPATSAGLTLSRIMLQKYIALYGWGVQQTWTDMRKYHYTDIDPATGNQVYASFTPPSGVNLISTNNGNLVYRCRPRYNSEYLYNIPELTRLGALNTDYNTYKPWFALP
ncbi:MAG: SusD/RagB family nutrient-binding outer membrane lipoprotein [Chitinophagaceae bacterium]|nr:SusD/RagB family nutrient-binding outer membrane lipoprotein [Chitinophagaceae bacterium]MBK9485810.1 SusD/RagB family nutrient-binding outer membrane lipoprotein [Chitinophagaceae bacterium]